MVARYLGVVEAVGSSPVTPTMKSLQFSVRTFCFILITISIKNLPCQKQRRFAVSLSFQIIKSILSYSVTIILE